LADELLGTYQHIIDDLVLKTSSGGAFEVTVNGNLIYSKKTVQKRHAEPGEILAIFQDIVGPDVPTFPTES
jgi:predicted Rdx family selenoprotein